MSRFKGAIDCDVHIAVPAVQVLYRYLSPYWKQFMIDCNNPSLEPNYYPPKTDLAARPGSRPADGKLPGSDFDLLRKQVLDEPGATGAILSCLYGAQVVRNDGWAAAISGAVNDWMADEWLARDPRFYGSIMVPWQNIEMSVAEIERCASNKRFVQILLLARSELPLGRPFFWPIYEAAQRHNLPIMVHAGGGMGNPNMSVGWNYYYAEDYLSVPQNFQAQLVSLVAEGVFNKFPSLKVVFAESGFTWLPALMWRLDKNWKGLRREVPWLQRRPSDYIKEHVRFTLQPTDEPANKRHMAEILEQIGSDDLLLYSTDYPHWQYDEEGPLPFELPAEAEAKILRGNAERTFTFS